MSNPTTYNFDAYYDNTFGLVFVFNDSAGDPFDIASNFTTASLKVFTKNNEASPLVELDLDSGLTISDTNRLLGEITPAQNVTLFGSPIKYYQLTVTYDGDKETVLKGIYIVNRAQSGSANDTALTLTVSLAPLEVTVSVADNAFLALQAKNEVEEIVSQLEPTRAGKGYATKLEMDADTTQVDGTTGIVYNDTASNNGYYFWDDDGNAWVKRAEFYTTVLDDTDESEAVTGKAVGDYLIDEVTGTEDYAQLRSLDISIEQTITSSATIYNTTLDYVGVGRKILFSLDEYTGSNRGTVAINLRKDGVTTQGTALGTGLNQATITVNQEYDSLIVFIPQTTPETADIEFNIVTLDQIDDVVIVDPREGIVGINNAIDSLQPNGGTVKLKKGTYTGSVGVVMKANTILQGVGQATVIDRTSGNDIFANVSSYINSTVRDLKCSQIARTGTSPDQIQFKVLNCYVNDLYINDSAEEVVNIIKIGKGLQYEKISDVYDRFNSVDLTPTNVRWQLHIYGHIVETSLLGITKNRIDLIGHNAVVEMASNNKVDIFRFLDQNNELYGPGLEILVKDIHFLRTGTMNAWDFPCASIETDFATFENVTFENATKSPTAFDQRVEATGGDNVNGARRHGAVITAKKNGEDCKLRLINCTGIGSPFGFQNTRGFYIIGGSPKMYNCTGYGGGIGEFGHGIIIHRYSSPKLFNCIGIASKWSLRGACGIRFQTTGNAELHDCVGIGGNGLQYISNGEVEGEVDIESLGTNNIDSHGISFNLGKSLAELYDCVGYHGSGINSKGLHIVSGNEPKIFGGKFGFENRIQNIVFTKDVGELFQTYSFNSEEINTATPYTVSSVVISRLSAMSAVPTGTLLRVETDELTPKVLIDDEICDNTINSIYLIPFNEINVDAGVGLKISFKDGVGNPVSVADSALWLTLSYNYNSTGCNGLFLDDTSAPISKSSIFKSNNASNAAYINSSGEYRIIDSIIECGDETKKAIEAESSLSNVKIFNSKIKGVLTDVNSFQSEVALLSSSNTEL